MSVQLTRIGVPPRTPQDWDVPATQIESALTERQQLANHPEPEYPECAHCGSRKGPWVPAPCGARYPSGAQILVCGGRCVAADPDRHALDLDADQAFAQLAANWHGGTT